MSLISSSEATFLCAVKLAPDDRRAAGGAKTNDTSHYAQPRPGLLSHVAHRDSDSESDSWWLNLVWPGVPQSDRRPC